MNERSLLQQIEAAQFHVFPQPEWNKSGSVSASLLKIVGATDAQSCSAAYDGLLYAVGNNHAGTYYPVLLGAMPVLESIVEEASPWAQRAVLCVLDDLFASFHPEPGYEKVLHPELGSIDVEASFRSRVHGLVPVFARISAEGGINAELARELLCLVEGDNA